MMDYMKPSFRHSDKVRNCRACAEDIPKDTPAVIWWAGFNRGNIVLCKQCVESMKALTEKEPLPIPPKP